MTGIIAAMKEEIKPLINKIKLGKIVTIGKIKYYIGTIYSKKVVICVCGVGKVNAAAASQAMILKFKPSLIFNLGLGGSASETVGVGEMVVAENSVQYDVDTSALNDPVGMISTINLIKLPCHNSLSKKIFENVKRNVPVHLGVVASGDKFLSSRSELCKINKKFNAIAVDMEAASIAQVCYINDVKFVCLKIISDSVFKSDETERGNLTTEYSKSKEVFPKVLCESVYEIFSNIRK